jgi:hypothetical protein
MARENVAAQGRKPATISSTIPGAAAEHYVMWQSLWRDIIAALSQAGVPNCDLVVTDKLGSKVAPVQVAPRHRMVCSVPIISRRSKGTRSAIINSAVSLLNDKVRCLLKLEVLHSRIVGKQAFESDAVTRRSIWVGDTGGRRHIARHELPPLLSAILIRFGKRVTLGFVTATADRVRRS